MLRVTPVYGSYGHHPSSPSLSCPPSSTLVEYGGVRVLINVGWDESFPPPSSTSSSSPTASSPRGGPTTTIVPPPELPDVDVILVTDSTLGSLGGLPVYLGPSRRRRRGATKDPSSSEKSGGDDGDDDGGAAAPPPSVPPIYGTYPTVKMGQMTLYDHHATTSLDGSDPGYALSDVDHLFSVENFKTLKYSQTLVLKDADGKDALGVTPHRSGRVVGGSFYVLKRLRDETEVVVATSYHHARERHLDSASLMKFGAAADVLVTCPGGPGGALSDLYRPDRSRGNKSVLPSPLVGRSEGELVELIMAALRRDGNVLCPVDASGRVLELLLLLSRHWDKNRLGGAYNLCWVGPMAWNTIEFARSQLEWMAAPLGAQFDSQRGHPYALKSVNICSSIAELDAVIEASGNNPTAVLASGASLDCGPARDLLLRWSENPDNAVILTDSSRCVPRGDAPAARERAARGLRGAGGGKSSAADGTAAAAAAAAAEDEAEDETDLAGSALPPDAVSSSSTSAQLLSEWCAAKASGREMADVVEVDAFVPHRAPLAGPELSSFLAEEDRKARAKKVEEERRAMLREVELAKGRLRLGEEDATGGGGGGGTSGTDAAGEKKKKKASSPSPSAKGAGAGGKQPPKKKSRFDSNLFLKFSKPIHMTFEVREEAVGIGQSDSTAKYGITESIGAGRSGEVLEDDYGIAVESDRFVDIVTGVDPSKYAGGTGRIGEEVLKRGLGFGSDGRPVLASSGGLPVALRSGAEKGGLKDTSEGGVEDDELALEASDLSEGKGIIRGRNGRPPIKVSTIPRRLEVLAEVAYVSLEGRVDARAARQSVRALQPRQVVILGGGEPRLGKTISECSYDPSREIVGEAGLLADAVRSLTTGGGKGSGGSNFAPADGETVELNVGHAAYSVRLIDTPYLSREEREAAAASGEDPAVDVPLEPYEAKMGECTVSLLDCVATGQKVALDGSIVLAPHSAAQERQQRQQQNIMLSDGDVLLTDLRSEVIAQGMKAEYSAHSGYSQLVVNGKIIVKKNQSTGKIDVEGPLCEDFFTVRSVVCGQYITL